MANQEKKVKVGNKAKGRQMAKSQKTGRYKTQRIRTERNKAKRIAAQKSRKYFKNK